MSEATTGPGQRDSRRVPVGKLLALTPVALLVGVVCALLLWGISAVASILEHFLWHTVTSWLGITDSTWWWILLVLTIAGVLVGLVIRFAPGHAGDDPATQELVSTPIAVGATPGLAIVAILALAGGVSLGPESPIMVINAAIVVAVGVRLVPKVDQNQWMGLSTAATLGALFGTPVAAALMLSEANPGDQRIPLWNRLYLPLVAAATGSFVILRFTDLTMSIDLPAEKVGSITDTLIAVGVAVVIAACGVVAAFVFDPLHRVLHRSLRDPVIRLTVVGAILGGLGILGGTITLFKGLDQMKELPDRIGTTTAIGFFAFAGIKMCAMLLASAGGFRGGRIFPSVFAGAAAGFGIHVLWPSLPLTITVAASIVGIVVAATRNGWISLFLGLAVVPQLDLLIPLLFATLPAWLVVANAPELRAKPVDGPSPDAAGST